MREQHRRVTQLGPVEATEKICYIWVGNRPKGTLMARRILHMLLQRNEFVRACIGVKESTKPRCSCKHTKQR